jgi:hypothetical protein
VTPPLNGFVIIFLDKQTLFSTFSPFLNNLGSFSRQPMQFLDEMILWLVEQPFILKNRSLLNKFNLAIFFIIIFFLETWLGLVAWSLALLLKPSNDSTYDI